MELLRQCSYPDVALVGGADASLDVDALRPLGLLRWDRTDQGSMVFTGNMADEGTHCRERWRVPLREVSESVRIIIFKKIKLVAIAVKA